jgi:16S rRNA processing protein RimM
MDDFKDYFYLGKVIKQHGYSGKLSIYFDTDEPEEYLNIEMVFINISGNLVPYFISELSLLNNKAVVSFADVNNDELARELVDKEIYLPLDLLPTLSGNKFYYHEVPGMMVEDKGFGKIGKVKAVLEYPNQAVLQVFHDKKEVLIPISNQIIVEFNRENSTIVVNAPDGLLDLYLSN